MPAPMIAIGIAVLFCLAIAMAFGAIYLFSGAASKWTLDMMVLSFVMGFSLLVAYAVYGYSIGVLGR